MLPGQTYDPTPFLLESQIAAAIAHVAVLRIAKCIGQGNEAAMTALVAATALLRQVEDLADALAPGQETDGLSGTLAGHAAGIRALLASLQEYNYKTNDTVLLRGGLEGDRVLQISGLEPIPLGKRQWLLAAVLARHALANPGAYLGVNEIVDALQEDPARVKAGFWTDVSPEDVHRAIRELREDIERAGGNPRLFESSKSYGGGYRLSTPSWNVEMEDLDAE